MSDQTIVNAEHECVKVGFAGTAVGQTAYFSCIKAHKICGWRYAAS